MFFFYVDIVKTSIAYTAYTIPIQPILKSFPMSSLVSFFCGETTCHNNHHLALEMQRCVDCTIQELVNDRRLSPTTATTILNSLMNMEMMKQPQPIYLH